MPTLDNVTIVETDNGQQTATASVGVNQNTNPTTVSTGLTNSLFLDSFFLPLLIALAGVWLYRQGFVGLPKWANLIKATNKENRAQKELQEKINQIRQKEVSVR